jgi:hypothetical protein
MRSGWPVSSGRWPARCRPMWAHETAHWLRALHDLPETSPTADASSGKKVHVVSRVPATLAAARGTFDCSRRGGVPFEPAACTHDATYR